MIKIKKGLLALLILLVLVGCSPKESPTIEVIVRNANQTYYMDLLITEKEAGEQIVRLNREDYQLDMIEALENHLQENSSSSLVMGSVLPLTGNLLGEVQGNERVHQFSYDVFDQVDSYQEGFARRVQSLQIVVVDQNLNVYESEILEFPTYHSTIYYDFQTKQAYVQAYGFNILAFALLAFVLVLAFDGALFVMFGFSLSKNSQKYLLSSVLPLLFIALMIANAYYRDSIGFAQVQLFFLTILYFIGKSIVYLIQTTDRKKSIALLYVLASVLQSLGWFSLLIWLL